MADASFVQDNFTGGEWSSFAQGRITDPIYKAAMSTCLNAYPSETGVWIRRTGSRELATTRWGRAGRVTTFNFSQTAPFTVELTDARLRLFNKNGLVFTKDARNVTNISTDSPAIITTAAYTDETWATGDSVRFFFPAAGACTLGGQLLGQDFVIAVTDGTHFTIQNALNQQPIDGSQLAWDGTQAVQVARVLEFVTPYINGDWAKVRFTQDGDSLYFFHPNYPTYVLTAAAECGNVFDFRIAQFIDGPYLDPPTDGSFLTPSAQSGSITLTLGYGAYAAGTTYANGSAYNPTGLRPDIIQATPSYNAGSVVSSGTHDYVSIVDNNTGNTPASSPSQWLQLNDGQVIGLNGFQSTDIGRLVRLLSEPADWISTSTYASNSVVKYQDQYWIAVAAVKAGDTPGNNVNSWGIAANAATWTWGVITAVGSQRAVTLSLVGGNLQYNTTIRVFRMGAYSYSTQFPSCGCLDEGRLILGGAIRNRFDMSVSNQHLVFSPTAPDGTVGDENAISYVMDSPVQNQICFITPNYSGLVMGTSGGEWTVTAASPEEPLTPTSIKAREYTKFGCANIEPARSPLATLFVQREQRKVMEYFGDLFSGKLVGKSLTTNTKHLTANYVEEIVYQQELAPIFWMRMGDGSLVGSTYRRESLMMAQPPDFNGWHRHTLGSGRKVMSIAVGPDPSGAVDTITMVTKDSNNIYYVEQLTQLYDEAGTLNNSWFLDGAKIPAGAGVTTVNGVQTLQLMGYAELNGQTVDVMIAGLDCGSFVVTNGCVFVPLDGSAGSLTLAYIQTYAANNPAFGFNNVPIISPSGVPVQEIQEFAEPAYFYTQSYTNRYTTLAVDFDGNRAWNSYNGNGPDAQMVAYNLTTGAQLATKTIGQMFGFADIPYWVSTTVYQAATQVRTVSSLIYTAAQGRNSNHNPDTDTAHTWWAGGTVIPGTFNASTTYASAAQVCGDNGATYWVAIVDFPHHNPLDDDGTQWQPINPSDPRAFGAANWGTALTFHTGDVVTLRGRFHIYQSLSNGNIGNTPQTDGGVHWADLGPVPPLWDKNTVYPAAPIVTGSNRHQYASIAANNVGHDPTTDGGVHWVFVSNGPSVFLTNGLLFSGVDDKLYMQQTSGQIHRINAETLLIEAAGTSTQMFDFCSSGAETDQQGHYGTWIAGSDDGVSNTAQQPILFNTGAMQAEVLPAVCSIAEGSRALVCAAPPGVIGVENSCCCATADFYFLGRPPTGGAFTTPITLYKLSINPEPIQGESRYTWTVLGQLTPANIDATWTHIFQVPFMFYDKTDGNIVMGINTSDAVATTNYVMKVNVQNFKIIWKTAVTDATSVNGFQAKLNNCFNGEFMFLEAAPSGGNGIARYINTMTGTQSTITYSHYAVPTGTVVYNDVTGFYTGFIINFQTGAANDPILGPNTSPPFTGLATFTIGRQHLTYNAPGVVGYPYASQGQILTPMAPETSGARNGPGVAKTKRTHMMGVSFVNTAQGSTVIGTDFNTMHPANFRSPSGIPVTKGSLYSGTYWDTVENQTGFFSALAWKVTGPFPCAITNVTQFLHTQDR